MLLEENNRSCTLYDDTDVQLTDKALLQ